MNLLPVDIDFFCNWKPEEIRATDDSDLSLEAVSYRRDIEKEWLEMQLVMSTYPEYFHPQIIDRSLFMTIFAQVCSRCFGWGLPTTAMIPMADNMNHSHGTCVNEAINKRYQMLYEKGSKQVPRTYFTREKFMNDYSTIFSA